MNRSTPGLPVHHQVPEFTQTHVNRVRDAIQPSHPLSSPSPPAPNPFQHQGLFRRVNSLHEVAKVLEFQLQLQSFQWTISGLREEIITEKITIKLVFSHVWFSVTLWIVAHQVPLSMGLFRQEYQSGLPPGDLPNPGIEPVSPASQADSLLAEPFGKPIIIKLSLDRKVRISKENNRKRIFLEERKPLQRHRNVKPLGWRNCREFC